MQGSNSFSRRLAILLYRDYSAGARLYLMYAAQRVILGISTFSHSFLNNFFDY